MATHNTQQTDLLDDEEWRISLANRGANGALQPTSETDDSEIEESAVDRVFSVLADARGAERATVKLFRVTTPGTYGWCEDFTIEQFEAGGFSMIRDRWGPGEYEIRLYAIRPTDGRFGVRAKPRITIVAGNDEPAPKNAPPAVDPAMREMLAQMANTQAQMLQALTQRPDPMANMQQMLGLMATMKQALGIGEAPQKSSISEIVQAVRELREVSSEINPAKIADDDADNPMKLLPSVLDLVGKFAPQQQAALPAPQAFPAVSLPASMAGAVNPAASADAVSLPVTQAAPIGDDQPDPSDEEMNALQMVLLRGYLAKLCKMSATGDVESAALFAYEKMPDEAFEILENPAWFEALSQFYPAAAQHREWLGKVRDRMLQLDKEA